MGMLGGKGNVERFPGILVHPSPPPDDERGKLVSEGEIIEPYRFVESFGFHFGSGRDIGGERYFVLRW